MRSVSIPVVTLALSAASLFAADRVPSAVRARQIPAGSQFRNVQDSQPRTYADDEPMPQLGEPSEDDSPSPFGDREPVPATREPAPSTGDAPAFESPGPTFPSLPGDGPLPAPGTEGPMLPRSTFPDEAPLGAPAVVQPVPANASSNLWIVSSRQCPQQGIQACLRCGLGYFHCERAGRPARSDEAAFCRSLQPGVPVCIVVHGSYTDWATVCEDACATQRWLCAAAPHLPLQIVFYSWPSDAATPVLPPIDIEILGTRAAFNGMYLSQLVQRIPKESPVCLMGHSHGARAIASCLHLLGGGDVQGYRYQNVQAIPHRIRTVFLAGAIDHHWLSPGQRYSAAVPRTEALLNVRNSRDFALGFYTWRGPFSGTAVGREGLTMQDLRGLGPYASRIREVDVAPLLRDDHLWPGYLRRPEIATAAVPYVYFVDDPNTGVAPAGVLSTPQLQPTPADQARRFVPMPGFARYRSAPARNPGSAAVNRPAPAASGHRRFVSPYGSPSSGPAPTTTRRTAPASPSYGSNAYRSYPPGRSQSNPYGVQTRPGAAPGNPANRPPATLGLPETSSSAPRPLEGTSVQRTNGAAPNPGSSLQPIESPRSVPIEPAPAVEDEMPRIEAKPFERPRNKIPSIFRRYYPEASLNGDEPT